MQSETGMGVREKKDGRSQCVLEEMMDGHLRCWKHRMDCDAVRYGIRTESMAGSKLHIVVGRRGKRANGDSGVGRWRHWFDDDPVVVF